MGSRKFSSLIRLGVFFDWLVCLSSVRCLSVAGSRGLVYSYFVDHTGWGKFMLLYRTQVTHQVVCVVDGAQFLVDNSVNLSYNLTDMLSDVRVNLVSKVSFSNLKISSASNIFFSCVWLERELGEFSNIYFTSLSDTRRLLLDYFEIKGFQQTHVSNDKYLNEIFYEVELNV